MDMYIVKERHGSTENFNPIVYIFKNVNELCDFLKKKGFLGSCYLEIFNVMDGNEMLKNGAITY